MTASQVFRNTLVVILTVVTAYVLFLSLHIVVVLLVAIIMASALRPAVLWLEKYVPQAVAILLPYLVVMLVSIGVFVIILPPAVERLGVYIENDDRLAAKLISANRWAETSIDNIFHPEEPTVLFDPDSIRNSVSSTVTSVRRSIPSMAGEAGSLLGDVVLVLVIGIYWLTSRDQAVEFTLQLFSGGKRPMVKQIIDEIEQALGAYVRGVGLVVLFVGIANFILLTIFRVPNATTLAFVIGITTALPIIGGFVGAGIAVFLALLETPVAGLLTLASFVVVQQVETHYLTPRTMSKSVHISPILVIVALFIGFAVGGVVGGLIAVPIAGTLMVLARYLLIDPKKDSLTPQRAQGGILIAGQDSKIHATPPTESGTAP